MVAPVLEGAARRWFYKHVGISMVVGIVAAEAWYRGYEIPRREKRNRYYEELGVKWTPIVE